MESTVQRQTALPRSKEKLTRKPLQENYDGRADLGRKMSKGARPCYIERAKNSNLQSTKNEKMSFCLCVKRFVNGEY